MEEETLRRVNPLLGRVDRVRKGRYGGREYGERVHCELGQACMSARADLQAPDVPANQITYLGVLLWRKTYIQVL